MARDRTTLELTATYKDKGAGKGVKSLRKGVDGVGISLKSVLKIAGGVAAAFGAFKLASFGVNTLKSALNGAAEALKIGVREGAASELQLQKIDHVARELGDNLSVVAYELKSVDGVFRAIPKSTDVAGGGVVKLRDQVAKLANELQLLAGIGDDKIGESFARMYSETQDAELSLDAMRVAVDVAATSGKDLTTVVEALTRSMMGEDMLLERMLPSLRQVDMETMSAADKIDYLRERYMGAAEAIKNNPLIAGAALSAEVIDSYKAVFNPEALERFGEAARGIATALDAMNDKGPFSALGDEISTNYKMAAESMSHFLTVLADDKAIANINKLMKALGLISDESAGLGQGSAFEVVASAISSFFMNLSKSIETISQQDIDSIVRSITNVRVELLEWAGSGLDKISNTVNAIDKIASAVVKFANAVETLSSKEKLWKRFWNWDGAGDTRIDRFFEEHKDDLPIPEKRAGGGRIPGRGNRDSVPAMLTPGEVVMNDQQQAAMGSMFGMDPRSIFSAAGVPGFAAGGKVPHWDNDRLKELTKGMSYSKRKAAYKSIFGGNFDAALAGLFSSPGGAPEGSAGEPATKTVNAPPEIAGSFTQILKAGFWNQTGMDVGAVEKIAQSIGNRIVLLRKFPSIGAGIGGDSSFTAGALEIKMKKMLDAIGSSWGNRSPERWAKGYASGGEVWTGSHTPKAPKSKAIWNRRGHFGNGGGGNTFHLHTLASDATGLRRFGMLVRGKLRTVNDRSYQSRGWEGFDRYEFA